MQTMEDRYRDHSQMVFRYLLSLPHGQDVSEELTQETLENKQKN